MGDPDRLDAGGFDAFGDLLDGRAAIFEGRDLGQVVAHQPVAVVPDEIEAEDDTASGNASQLRESQIGIEPMVDGQDGQRCGEGFVGEGQGLGDPADHRGFASAALAQHLSRGLDGKDPA